jgi:hypothetical protein
LHRDFSDSEQDFSKLLGVSKAMICSTGGRLLKHRKLLFCWAGCNRIFEGESAENNDQQLKGLIEFDKWKKRTGH